MQTAVLRMRPSRWLGVDVLDVLIRLVDRSLVSGARLDGPRYRLLESVAAYCVDKLRAAGELERCGSGISSTTCSWLSGSASSVRRGAE